MVQHAAPLLPGLLDPALAARCLTAVERRCADPAFRLRGQRLLTLH